MGASTVKVSERRLWVYAATFGALWGSVESVLGVFLHALRLPFTGFILTLLSVLIMAAQRHLCPVRGVTLATGAIAASIRAVAPATVIWGPLVGITMEAAVFELACLLIPHRLTAAWVGGALAATWTLSQGVLTKLLVYGAALWDVVVEMTSAFLSKLGLDATYVWWGLGVVLGGTLISGALAAWAGVRMATSLPWSRTDRLPSWALLAASAGTASTVPEGGVEGQNGTPSLSGAKRVAAWAWWSLGVASAVSFLASQWVCGLWLSAVAVVALGVALYQRYPGQVKRVFRLRFWLFSILVTLAAGLFLGPKDAASHESTFGLSQAGLEAGLGMLFRALFLVLVTVWLGLFLAKPAIRKRLRAVGPGPFFDAIQAASQTVPALIKRLSPEASTGAGGGPDSKAQGYRRLFSRHFIRGVLHEAHQVALEQLATYLAPPVRPTILLAWGGPGTGKTTWMAALSDALSSKGIRTDGVLQPKILGPVGQQADGPAHRGYQVLALVSGRRKTVASARGRPKPGAMRFRFHRGIFDWAAKTIEEGAASADCLLLDEFGHLEAQGLGHFPALTRALFNNQARFWVLCVRETRKEDARKLLQQFDVEWVSIASTSTEALASRIARTLSEAKTSATAEPVPHLPR